MWFLGWTHKKHPICVASEKSRCAASAEMITESKDGEIQNLGTEMIKTQQYYNITDDISHAVAEMQM